VQELYFRRLHSLAAKRPNMLSFAHRKEMWTNYCELFKLLNDTDAPLNLPNVWLWDMVDEFLYQFQIYRALAGQANQQPDIDFLRANPDVWSAEKVQPSASTPRRCCVVLVYIACITFAQPSVAANGSRWLVRLAFVASQACYAFWMHCVHMALAHPSARFLCSTQSARQNKRARAQVQGTLEAFVASSRIRDEVAADNGKQVFETGGFVGKSNVRRMLGYFSLVGLCRFHSVMGRHEAALRALSPLNPYNRQHLYTAVIPMAHVNLYYYAGVSYLMLRRYVDAGRCFNTVLSFLIRVKRALTCAPSRPPGRCAAAAMLASDSPVGKQRNCGCIFAPALHPTQQRAPSLWPRARARAGRTTATTRSCTRTSSSTSCSRSPSRCARPCCAGARRRCRSS
jgi:RNA polymerase I-associated factor PAF67